MNFDDLDMTRLRGLAGNKWQRYASEVLPAWVADMDFQQAAPIRDYVAYYNAERVHSHLGDSPEGRLVQPRPAPAARG